MRCLRLPHALFVVSAALGTHVATLLQRSRPETRTSELREREAKMLISQKLLLAGAAMAALVGGGLGALTTNSSQRTEAANDRYQNAQAANTGPAAERD